MAVKVIFKIVKTLLFGIIASPFAAEAWWTATSAVADYTAKSYCKPALVFTIRDDDSLRQLLHQRLLPSQSGRLLVSYPFHNNWTRVGWNPALFQTHFSVLYEGKTVYDVRNFIVKSRHISDFLGLGTGWASYNCISTMSDPKARLLFAY